MKRLLDSNPSARKLAKTARAVLIFPKIFKASFVFGGSNNMSCADFPAGTMGNTFSALATSA